jgi:hypothetical protein
MRVEEVLYRLGCTVPTGAGATELKRSGGRASR